MEEKNWLLARKYILQYLGGDEFPEDLPFEVEGKIYCFKENFLKLVGKTPFNANIRDYKNGVVDYLNNAYPYCFALGGVIERHGNLDDALRFYAKSRGASEEQAEQVIPMLKEIKLPEMEIDSFSVQSTGQSVEMISIDHIGGSAIKRYKASNLYDALVAADDKNIQGFINYLVVNNVFNPFYVTRTMNRIWCCRDEDNNLLVAEGNHRVITLKALQAIRAFVEDYQLSGPMFNATVEQVKKIHSFN